MRLNRKIDQFGTAGLWLTMLVSPCCFPLAAVIATALGFSTTAELFGEWTFYILQSMVVLSLIGLVLTYRINGFKWPLLLAIPSALGIFYSYHFLDADNWTLYFYAGMTGLLLASIINHIRMKSDKQIILLTTITCPHCGFKSDERMPTDSCQFFYECGSCRTVLKPVAGDCCVYCSYGSVKCPPIQTGNSCC